MIQTEFYNYVLIASTKFAINLNRAFIYERPMMPKITFTIVAFVFFVVGWGKKFIFSLEFEEEEMEKYLFVSLFLSWLLSVYSPVLSYINNW